MGRRIESAASIVERRRARKLRGEKTKKKKKKKKNVHLEKFTLKELGRKSKLRAARNQVKLFLKKHNIEVPKQIGQAMRLFASELGFEFKVGYNCKKFSEQLLDLYDDPNFTAIGKNLSSSSFYTSLEWGLMRKKVFSRLGKKCLKCGSKEKLHIDHIKPRSKYPELELDIDNLQVLCRSCNISKSNRDQTDYRVRSNNNID